MDEARPHRDVGEAHLLSCSHGSAPQQRVILSGLAETAGTCTPASKIHWRSFLGSSQLLIRDDTIRLGCCQERRRHAVAKTRHDIDRDRKVDEILGVAESQLLAGGYGSLSMVGVARELGVVQNAIYWYFPTKDHLFVAVLRRILVRTVARKPPEANGFVNQAVWIVDRLADFHGLGVTVHERARTSTVVAEFKEEFQSLLHEVLTGALSAHVPMADLEIVAASFMSTVEGALLRGVPRREREAIVRYTLERLTGAAPSADQPSRR